MQDHCYGPTLIYLSGWLSRACKNLAPGSTLLQRISGAPQIEWSIQKRIQHRGLRVRGKASSSKSCHMSSRKFYESSCGRGDPPTCSTSRANFRRLHCSVEIDRTRRGSVSASSELAQRCQADTRLAVERVGLDASGSIVGNRCGGGAARLAFRLVFKARRNSLPNPCLG